MNLATSTGGRKTAPRPYLRAMKRIFVEESAQMWAVLDVFWAENEPFAAEKWVKSTLNISPDQALELAGKLHRGVFLGGKSALDALLQAKEAVHGTVFVLFDYVENKYTWPHIDLQAVNYYVLAARVVDQADFVTLARVEITSQEEYIPFS